MDAFEKVRLRRRHSVPISSAIPTFYLDGLLKKHEIIVFFCVGQFHLRLPHGGAGLLDLQFPDALL
jgi:hypothetical protein